MTEKEIRDENYKKWCEKCECKKCIRWNKMKKLRDKIVMFFAKSKCKCKELEVCNCLVQEIAKLRYSGIEMVATFSGQGRYPMILVSQAYEERMKKLGYKFFKQLP